jgi:hypothetical protein
MSIRYLYRCPYCPRRGSHGVLSADVSAIRDLPPGVSETSAFGAGNFPGQSSGVFLFNPDGVPNGPCPHLISCCLDAEVLRVRQRRVVERPHTLVLSWDHAWFAQHDPGDDLNAFLWTELEDGIDDAFDPTTPYVNPLVSRYAPIRGKALKAKFSGTMFFALDAERFLADLRDGYRRMQGV